MSLYLHMRYSRIKKRNRICQKPASSRRVNLKLSMRLYKVLKQHVPSQSGICWSHLKMINEMVNEGEKAASEGHGIAKVNVTELQNQRN